MSQNAQIHTPVEHTSTPAVGNPFSMRWQPPEKALTSIECPHRYTSGYGNDTCLYCGRTHPAVTAAALEFMESHRRPEKRATQPKQGSVPT